MFLKVIFLKAKDNIPLVSFNAFQQFYSDELGNALVATLTNLPQMFDYATP